MIPLKIISKHISIFDNSSEKVALNCKRLQIHTILLSKKLWTLFKLHNRMYKHTYRGHRISWKVQRLQGRKSKGRDRHRVKAISAQVEALEVRKKVKEWVTKSRPSFLANLAFVAQKIQIKSISFGKIPIYYRIWTPSEDLFSSKYQTFELGQTIWTDKFWGILGIFDRFISIHFGIVRFLSMFFINRPLLFTKTKLLYQIPKIYLRLGFEFEFGR